MITALCVVSRDTGAIGLEVVVGCANIRMTCGEHLTSRPRRQLVK